MKIKTDNIEFESFNDGICDIYTEDDEGKKNYKYKHLGYSDRTLGYNRVFAAKAVQEQINAVIRIPLLINVNEHDIVKIENIGRFEIQLAQVKLETNPQSIDLTLKQLEMFKVGNE